MIKRDSIVAAMGILFLVPFIVYSLYLDFHRYDVFIENLNTKKITLLKAEEPIKLRGINCSYQVHFEAMMPDNKKVRARYCVNAFSRDGTINLKEVLKD